MKILLINLKEPTCDTQKRSVIPPIGLWKIRSVLKRHEVDICDENIGDKTEDFIRKEYYPLIGISARFSIQHKEYLRIVEMCHRCTDSTIVAGGIHAQNVQVPDGVSMVSNIPGEQFFRKFFFGAEGNYKEKWWLAEEKAFPEFAYREMMKYWCEEKPHDLQSKTKRWFPIETSRGCVNQCTYCGVKGLWGNWHPFSQDHIKKLLKYLAGKNVTELFIEDDNISLDIDRFRWIMKQFNKFGMAWSCPNGIQVKHLTKPGIIDQMADSGCWRVSLPFETGSEQTGMKMKLWGKWMQFPDARKLVDELKKKGILACGFFIIGYPGETEDDVKQTLDYANKLQLDQRNIYIATPYPGTELYKLCVDNGYLTCSEEQLYDNLLYTRGVISTPQLSAERVEQIKRDDREAALKRKSLL